MRVALAIMVVICIALAVVMLEMTKRIERLERNELLTDKDITKVADALLRERTERRKESAFIHSRVDGIARKTDDICRRYVLYITTHNDNAGVPWAQEVRSSEDE